MASTTHWRYFIRGATQMSKLSKLFMVLSFLSFAVPPSARANPPGAVTGAATAAGFSRGLAPAFCARPQGRPPAAAAESLARNPAARPGIQLALILGLALIESLALY